MGVHGTTLKLPLFFQFPNYAGKFASEFLIRRVLRVVHAQQLYGPATSWIFTGQKLWY